MFYNQCFNAGYPIIASELVSLQLLFSSFDVVAVIGVLLIFGFRELYIHLHDLKFRKIIFCNELWEVNFSSEIRNFSRVKFSPLIHVQANFIFWDQVLWEDYDRNYSYVGFLLMISVGIVYCRMVSDNKWWVNLYYFTCWK